MSWDDIIYLACLLGCIVFGYYYRKISDVSNRKIIGTVFGLFITFVTSGLHILHPIVSCLICAILIIKLPKHICHIASFAFMFSYLLFFRTATYFGLPEPPGHTNMIQMVLTLKLVGLAFEANSAYKIGKEIKNKLSNREKIDYETKEMEELSNLCSLKFTDIFHYAFNYIGVLTGPYYRYRTFSDYFQTAYKDHADCFQATIDKLKWTAFYGVMFLVVSSIWPLSYATSAEFYEERSFFYRLCYVWPTFFIFRMRIYIGLTLSECVCTNAGFGAYPDMCDAASGEGPKQKSILPPEQNLEKLTYNFNTIKNIDVYETESCITFREAMKKWNICVQYWLAVNIYKRFPNKKYRTFATLLVSAFWHGVCTGHYFCIMGAPMYLPIEDIYNKLFRGENVVGLRRKITDVIFWISKMFSLSYLGTGFLLLTFEKILFYCNSVYHFGYIYWAVLLAVGMFLSNQRRKTRKDKDKPLDQNSVPNNQHIKSQ
uniref:Lysophospholipid acyltransferase 7 n=1 Tax=Tabanus bromius TaxID=304241 RepID=A0A0K8TNZ5_TABBR